MVEERKLTGASLARVLVHAAAFLVAIMAFGAVLTAFAAWAQVKAFAFIERGLASVGGSEYFLWVALVETIAMLALYGWAFVKGTGKIGRSIFRFDEEKERLSDVFE